MNILNISPDVDGINLIKRPFNSGTSYGLEEPILFDFGERPFPNIEWKHDPSLAYKTCCSHCKQMNWNTSLCCDSCGAPLE